MAEHHREPNYHLVLIWLAALTIAEIIVAKASLPTLTTGILLVGMALSKASLVALFFMHLKFETSTLMVIAGIPFIISTFLVFMLMPDLTAVEGGRTSSIRAEQTESGHK